MAADVEQCDCAMCQRHDESMARHELALTEPVDMLIGAGWFPNHIVKLVATGSPSSSRASTLVRISLVSLASAWQGEPSRHTQLFQARELSSRTGFRVESIRTGWFEQWFWQSSGGLCKAQLWTRHALAVLQPIVEFLELGVTTESQSKHWIGRPRRNEIERTSGRFMPEPHDPSWTYASESF